MASLKHHRTHRQYDRSDKDSGLVALVPDKKTLSASREGAG